MTKIPFTKGAARFISMLCLFLISILSSCNRPQTLAESGQAAFTALAQNNNAIFNNGYLTIAGPGGRDYIAISIDFSQTDDVLIGIDLSDFMKSGLDPQRLTPTDFAPDYPVYDLPTSTFVLACHLGDTKFDYSAYKDPQGKPLTAPNAGALFLELLRTDPSRVSLDAQTGLYRISFGNNASMHWNMTPAGKPVALTIALNATAFIKAGLEPSRLTKWKALPTTAPTLFELSFP